MSVDRERHRRLCVGQGGEQPGSQVWEDQQADQEENDEHAAQQEQGESSCPNPVLSAQSSHRRAGRLRPCQKCASNSEGKRDGCNTRTCRQDYHGRLIELKHVDARAFFQC